MTHLDDDYRTPPRTDERFAPDEETDSIAEHEEDYRFELGRETPDVPDLRNLRWQRRPNLTRRIPILSGPRNGPGAPAFEPWNQAKSGV